MNEMRAETNEAFMRLRRVCNEYAQVEATPHSRKPAQVIVDFNDLRLIVGWVHEQGLNTANDRIAAEKAADYDAIVRLLSRGFKGG